MAPTQKNRRRCRALARGEMVPPSKNRCAINRHKIAITITTVLALKVSSLETDQGRVERTDTQPLL
jgi:hypothetical protein